jgi:hypothetical protein
MGAARSLGRGASDGRCGRSGHAGKAPRSRDCSSTHGARALSGSCCHGWFRPHRFPIPASLDHPCQLRWWRATAHLRAAFVFEVSLIMHMASGMTETSIYQAFDRRCNVHLDATPAKSPLISQRVTQIVHAAARSIAVTAGLPRTGADRGARDPLNSTHGSAACAHARRAVTAMPQRPATRRAHAVASARTARSSRCEPPHGPKCGGCTPPSRRAARFLSSAKRDDRRNPPSPRLSRFSRET